MKNKCKLCILIISIILSGCGLQSKFIKSYAGQEKPNSEVALVKPYIYIRISSIDNDPSKRFNPWKKFGATDVDIALIPGMHTFTLFYYGNDAFSTKPVTITKKLEKGRKYLIMPNISGSSWSGYIVDVTDEPDRWCLHGKGCSSYSGVKKERATFDTDDIKYSK